jgi:cytochrome b561
VADRESARSGDGKRIYDAVSMGLHWSIAALVILNLLLAWRFEGLDGPARGLLIRFHKSAGVTILVLSAARLAWRAVKPAPAPPAGWRLRDRRVAKIAHRALYGLLVIAPLSGWLMISAASDGRPTLVWGVIPLPRFLPLVRLAPAVRDHAHGLLAVLHLGLALTIVAVVTIHLAGAVKHQLAGEASAFARMLPRRGGRSPPKPAPAGPG